MKVNSINSKYPEIGGASGGIQNASCLASNYTSTDPSIGTCVVKMLPIQKWVNVIVSVYNQVVDIYKADNNIYKPYVNIVSLPNYATKIALNASGTVFAVSSNTSLVQLFTDLNNLSNVSGNVSTNTSTVVIK